MWLFCYQAVYTRKTRHVLPLSVASVEEDWAVMPVFRPILRLLSAEVVWWPIPWHTISFKMAGRILLFLNKEGKSRLYSHWSHVNIAVPQYCRTGTGLRLCDFTENIIYKKWPFAMFWIDITYNHQFKTIQNLRLGQYDHLDQYENTQWSWKNLTYDEGNSTYIF